MSGNRNSVLAVVSRRLRSALPGTASGDARLSGSATTPDIAIVAYADDCILSGHMPLSGERISDVLNERGQFPMADALMQDLRGGNAMAVHAVVLQRDEVLFVDASGPRGNAGRRRHTCQHPIVAKAGPYEVRGNIHALPGSDPIASLRSRKPMIAITDATVAYELGATPQRFDVGLVLLNRDRIDWIARAPELQAALVEMPTAATGPLFKDYTGLLYA